VCKVKVFIGTPFHTQSLDFKTSQMIIVKQASTLARYIEKEKKEGKIVGFVPTLGALHQGHMTLIGQCRQSSDFTVVSIFVNPTQFNNISDYRKYPHVIEKDIALLATAGVDMLSYPFGRNIP